MEITCSKSSSSLPMGTRSSFWLKQNTWTLLPELPASKMTAYCLDMKLGENLREIESGEDLVGMRKSTKVISRRGTKTNSMAPRHLWNWSEKVSCCLFLFKLFSIWTCCCASKSSAAEGDRNRIWPFPPPGFNDWVSCTDSSSSCSLAFPSNQILNWYF